MLAEESCTLITFYSEPREAFLTSIFRVLEVFGCSYVEVFASRSREAEAIESVNHLRRLLTEVVFNVHPLFPEPSDLESFNGLVESISRIVKGFRERGKVVVAVFTGSRLEVSSTVLATSRVREDVVLVYVPFYWGPWNKLFYPFTPKPLEPLTILHPNAEDVKPLISSKHLYHLDHGSSIALLEGFGISSELRKELSYAQYKLNLALSPSTLLHPIDARCRGFVISIAVSGVQRLNIEINDYCSYSEIIRGVDELGSKALNVFSGSNDVERAVNLLLKFSGVFLPVVEECTEKHISGCSSYRDTLLVDLVSKLGEEILVDTNVIYSSIHTLLHEYKNNIAIPLCAYVELLRHRAHFEKGYEKLRSAIAALALNEIQSLKLNIHEKASQQPCEVGIALENKIAVTTDKKAYKEIFEALKTKAILVQLRPLGKIKFLKREDTRRIAYAYYAIAQLKALTTIKKVREALNEMRIAIEVEHD